MSSEVLEHERRSSRREEELPPETGDGELLPSCHEWREIRHEASNRTYYWNVRNNVTDWVNPSTKPAPRSVPLPEGWMASGPLAAGGNGGVISRASSSSSLLSSSSSSSSSHSSVGARTETKTAYVFNNLCQQSEKPFRLENGWTYAWSPNTHSLYYQRIAAIEEPAPYDFEASKMKAGAAKLHGAVAAGSASSHQDNSAKSTKTCSVNSATDTGAGGATTRSGATEDLREHQRQSQPLPKLRCHPWRSIVDEKSGKVYYWHSATKKTQWNPPVPEGPRILASSSSSSPDGSTSSVDTDSTHSCEIPDQGQNDSSHPDQIFGEEILPGNWRREQVYVKGRGLETYYVLKNSCYQKERPMPLLKPWTYEFDSAKQTIFYQQVVRRYWPVPLHREDLQLAASEGTSDDPNKSVADDVESGLGLVDRLPQAASTTANLDLMPTTPASSSYGEGALVLVEDIIDEDEAPFSSRAQHGPKKEKKTEVSKDPVVRGDAVAAAGDQGEAEGKAVGDTAHLQRADQARAEGNGATSTVNDPKGILTDDGGRSATQPGEPSLGDLLAAANEATSTSSRSSYDSSPASAGGTRILAFGNQHLDMVLLSSVALLVVTLYYLFFRRRKSDASGSSGSAESSGSAALSSSSPSNKQDRNAHGLNKRPAVVPAEKKYGQNRTSREDSTPSGEVTPVQPDRRCIGSAPGLTKMQLEVQLDPPELTESTNKPPVPKPVLMPAKTEKDTKETIVVRREIVEVAAAGVVDFSSRRRLHDQDETTSWHEQNLQARRKMIDPEEIQDAWMPPTPIPAIKQNSGGHEAAAFALDHEELLDDVPAYKTERVTEEAAEKNVLGAAFTAAPPIQSSASRVAATAPTTSSTKANYRTPSPKSTKKKEKKRSAEEIQNEKECIQFFCMSPVTEGSEDEEKSSQETIFDYIVETSGGSAGSMRPIPEDGGGSLFGHKNRVAVDGQRRDHTRPRREDQSSVISGQQQELLHLPNPPAPPASVDRTSVIENLPQMNGPSTDHLQQYGVMNNVQHNLQNIRRGTVADPTRQSAVLSTRPRDKRRITMA
ncbi:unnamed protein product [Amoebophrya sp. A120]|nr:unnamed protein product [Amoebophrya sp. A120]|eukprot:GSA120T00015515001.1